MYRPEDAAQLVGALAPRWIRLFRHGIELGLSAQRAALGCDLKPLRALWLEQLAKSVDDYLRSPAFLLLLQYNLRTMTQTARLISTFRMQ